jgi:hypothetical protein
MNDHIKASALKPGMAYRLGETGKFHRVAWISPHKSIGFLTVGLVGDSSRLLQDNDLVQIEVLS